MADLPSFREAYRKRRCIVPVDGFFEWKAVKGQRAKQPYAIAMKDGSPFGIAGIWENWKDLNTGEWIPTFAIITTDANMLVLPIFTTGCQSSSHHPKRYAGVVGAIGPARPDAAVSFRADADVAYFDARQQARE